MKPKGIPPLSLVWLIFTIALCLSVFPAVVLAWPTTNQWIPIYKSGLLLQDPNNDAQGSRNIVSYPTRAAVFIFNDGTYVYFRLRLDKSPAGIRSDRLFANKPLLWEFQQYPGLNRIRGCPLGNVAGSNKYWSGSLSFMGYLFPESKVPVPADLLIVH